MRIFTYSLSILSHFLAEKSPKKAELRVLLGSAIGRYCCSCLLNCEAFTLRVAHLVLQYDVALFAPTEVDIPRYNTRIVV